MPYIKLTKRFYNKKYLLYLFSQLIGQFALVSLPILQKNQGHEVCVCVCDVIWKLKL